MINLVISIAIAIISISIISVSIFLILRANLQKKDLKENILEELFQKHNFHLKKILYSANDNLIAVNRSLNVIAVVKNISQKDNKGVDYKEIPTSLIYKIEKINSAIKINYLKKNGNDFIYINFPSKEIKELVYKIYKNTILSKIQNKFPTQILTSSTGCNWECDFVWAYNPNNTSLFYYSKNNEKSYINYFNLLKRFITLDVKYNYLEVPLLGQMQQLYIYEPTFLNEVLSSLIETVKQKYISIHEDKIFYDSFNNIVYLSNGYSSFQTIILDEVEDIIYENTRILFTLKEDTKIIRFLADKEFISEFENFIITYNLRKIAVSFDYKTDVLINTTDSTKFIVDVTRDRVVYCANLNHIQKFNFLTISFDNLENATAQKKGNIAFARIQTKDNQTIDVSCKKPYLADYVVGSIKKIIAQEKQ